MILSKPAKVYLISSLLCSGLVLYGFLIYRTTLNAPASGCFFHSSFKIPCPACGGSHSIQALFHGQIVDAFRFNFLITSYMLISFITLALILWDICFGKKIYWKVYSTAGSLLAKRKISLCLAFILFLCWIYNIYNYASWY